MDFDSTLIQTRDLSRGFMSFRFTKPQGYTFEAGQYAILRLGDGLAKPFSFSCSPTEGAYLDFTTKMSGSEYKKRLGYLKAGDKVKISAPMGKFILRPGLMDVAFLAGGIGITPFHSLVKYIMDSKIDCDVVLMWGINAMEDAIFKDDFEAMRKENPRLKVVYVPLNPPAGWKGCTGFICEDYLRAEVPGYKGRTYYICGPPKMVEAMTKLLGGLQVRKEDIIIESFPGY